MDKCQNASAELACIRLATELSVFISVNLLILAWTDKLNAKDKDVTQASSVIPACPTIILHLTLVRPVFIRNCL